MRKRLLLFITNLAFALPLAAQVVIPYKPVDIHVNVPLNLGGLEKDTAHRVGDHYSYDVTGQVITDTITYQLQPISTSDRSTPWLTLQELYGAYRIGDLKKIKSLYTKESQKQINGFLASKEDEDNFLSIVKQNTAMRPYFGMEYDNGFIVLMETAPGHTERFFLKQVSGAWLLMVYDEKDIPTVNNVMTYYTCRPLPPLAPEIVLGIPDSLTYADLPFITFKLKKNSDWVSIFIPQLGIAVPMRAQDNGFNDNDNTSGVIKMVFYANKIQAGDYELEAIETNYPMITVNAAMIQSGTKFHVKIKEK